MIVKVEVAAVVRVASTKVIATAAVEAVVTELEVGLEQKMFYHLCNKLNAPFGT